MSSQLSEPQRENKMGVMPVNRLLLSMSLPMMVSMLVQALYNVVDSIFVSQISEAAFTAVSLAFPMQNLMISVAVGTGVGINALLSWSLGEKDTIRASKAANNGILLAAISCALFVLIGLFIVPTFFRAQTDIPEIIEFGIQYLSICCVASVGLFGQVTFERLLQSTGKTFLAMITQLVGAIINIILDPVLIFGLLGFPKLGIAGAAIATVLGQMVACVLAFFFNLKFNTEISFSLRALRLEGAIVRRIYAVGVPSIVMASIGSVMTFGMNKILMVFSSTAAAVFGAYFKVQSFIFMPVFGLNNGMVPILAYNYGAKRSDRMIQTIRLSVIYAVLIMVVGFAIFQFFPDKLLELFNASPDMLAMGIPSLRIISFSFLFAGFCIICSSVFQALGNGIMSLIVSVVRQLVVLLPVAFLFSLSGQLNLVWLAFPIAELFSVFLCSLFLRRVYHKEIQPLGTPK